MLGVVGFYVGWWLGHQITGPSLDYFSDTGQNDIALFLAYIVGVVGFLFGLGFMSYPIQRLLGKPPSLREKETAGAGRYFTLCTDHKVVGIQYLIGIGFFIFIGGLNAMLIRFELLSPTHESFNANNYLTLVGLHGTMMMGMMTSGILGPFANYLVPIMIGARRMAFPRIEALTFWLLMLAGVILMTTIGYGGFPTGWTGYAPLNDQANMGMDSYIVFFALVGHLDVAARPEHARDRDHDARAGDVVEPAADLRLGRRLDCDADAARRAGLDLDAVHGRARPNGADRVLQRAGRRERRTSTRTSSGSSATRRSTSSRCPGWGSCSRSCRCSRASRSGATGSRSPGCSGSRCSRGSSGSTTSSSAASTPICGRSTCSRPS